MSAIRQLRTLHFDTVGTETNLIATLANDNIGFGYDFSWQVQALRNGNVICSSTPIVLQRGTEVTTPIGGFSASWSCEDAGATSFFISWTNAPDPALVEITYGVVDFPTPPPIITSGASGTVGGDEDGGELFGGQVTSGGQSVPITPATLTCN